MEPPPEFAGEATAFEAGVDCGAGTKLPGAGVGDVVGTSRRVPGVVDGIATAMDGVAVGIATAAGAGRGTKPGNGLGGVGAAIGPSVGNGLATEGEGMGVGAGTD